MHSVNDISTDILYVMQPDWQNSEHKEGHEKGEERGLQKRQMVPCVLRKLNRYTCMMLVTIPPISLTVVPS